MASNTQKYILHGKYENLKTKTTKEQQKIMSKWRNISGSYRSED